MRGRLAVVTVGCKANFADSAGIAARAVRAGFHVVPPGDPADVLVVNSCTVTHKADRDSRALARRLRRENPGAVLVMTGCYAEVSPEARNSLPEVDHWIGIGDPEALSGILRSIAGAQAPVGEDLTEHAAGLLLGRTRTFLKVQDGCDARCAYCVVPKARGASRSVPIADVVERAVRAESEGARELVLTGIHVGRYGHDRGEREGLAGLLRSLLSATSACRFRLGSVEPEEATSTLAGLLAESGRVCPHLHVPLQSGSDRVLRRMRRPYTAGRYRERLHMLSSAVPGLRLGADVIAGFPGETDDDFGETLELLGDSPLSYLHAFSYSPRAGTESAEWADDVPASEKKRRTARLRAIDSAMRKKYLETQLGRTVRVIAETRGMAAGEFRGTSENYVDVSFRGEAVRAGDLVPVSVEAVDGFTLFGKAAMDHESR
ncbi:MAG: tRNA (N(6)-L-threonylcarbamoyladenosine(37)-C(2))-methylthiotransferase MtaB [Deltaproteobacteria bacterium]|nr:MAG: tRNA (N(6)-L-threonylcarbamoyladenosine(37)-C(2))-methylthiotransferase MtaB [Deltaproteobacteria bacterium]